MREDDTNRKQVTSQTKEKKKNQQKDEAEAHTYSHTTYLKCVQTFFLPFRRVLFIRIKVYYIYTLRTENDKTTKSKNK